ncbi:WxL domain-containing protein [Paenibacillus amylolyticus]|uniref:WxL domain-containing protein n=1 Tax=Paenibacillus amylolyticus TaxID=1451 RepID=UPI00201D4210|nr:WxL domain-containing protein [Paenibacillus amylolyticus]MCL6663429.1 WxL domain-containing protein [Paenibacillus amylolyticus]
MKKIAFSALLALALAIPSVASAEDIEKEVQVTGGNLLVTQSSLKFSDITLAVRQQQKSQAVVTSRVIDDRGNGNGWTVSQSATDFVTTIDGVNFYIPIDAVKVTASLKNTISGIPLDLTQGGHLAKDQVLSNQATPIFSADVSTGQGAYDFELHYTLSLPQIIKATGGKEIGVVAGTYKSTFTTTATSGI